MISPVSSVALLAFLGMMAWASDVAYADTSDKSNVILIQRFLGDEDKGQCGYEKGDIRASFGKWSRAIYVNTDNRRGGCEYSLALLDPSGAVAGLRLTITLSKVGPQPQCDHTGEHVVPISRDAASLVWSPKFRIDTDDREGGCQLAFAISGRHDIVLDVEFISDGDPSQCRGAGRHVVAPIKPAAIEIDTDSRPGGCFLRLRLRLRTGR